MHTSDLDHDRYRRDRLLGVGFSRITESCWQFDEQCLLTSWTGSGNGLYRELEAEPFIGMPYTEFLGALTTHGSITNLSQSHDTPPSLHDSAGSNDNSKIGFLHHLNSGQIVMVRHTTLGNDHFLIAAFDVTALKNEHLMRLEVDSKLREFTRISSDWSWQLDSDLRYVYHTSHKPSPSGTEITELTGMTRIDHVTPFTDKNEQLKIHNEKLLAHERLDVILSWTSKDKSTHSHIIAEPQFNAEGTFTGYLGCGRDVTKYQKIQQQLEYQAHHEELTGLLNRRAFASHLNAIIDERVNDKTIKPIDNIALITFDLDRFKLVNDQAGHIAGDRILVEITEILQNIFDKDATLARLGGDEFAILLHGNEQSAVQSAQRLINRIAAYRFNWKNRNFTIGASAGIAFMDASITASSELLSRSDIACYSAKQGGRNQVQTYSDQNSFQTQLNDELEKLQRLRSAHDNDRLALFLQPIVSADNGDIPSRFEALLRMCDEEGNWTSPGEFIPIAEKFDMMPIIDYWVVNNAITYLENFRESGYPVSISVNLSGNTLSNRTCLARITELVSESNIESHSLCFEITETAAISELETVSEFMQNMRELGCNFSLDDFGSGLSSYGYLSSLSLDYLKIDGSFVRNIVDDPTSVAIVKSFITLSHEMGMKTVAEFVENAEIAEVLSKLNIDYMQGYAFGKPQAAQEWLNLFEGELKLTGSYGNRY